MHSFLGVVRVTAATAIAAAVIVAAACSSEEGSSSGDDSAGAGADSSGNGNGSGAGFVGSGAGGSGSGTGGLEECASETQVGDLTPVDLVVMFDQSGSMASTVGSDTIWGLVTQAFTDFVNGAGTDGLSVGLQYFPLADGPCTTCAGCNLPNLQITDQTTNTCCCSPPTGQSCTTDGAPCPTGGLCYQGQCYSGGANATCDAAAYATLEVPIAELTTNAPALVASLGAHGPTGLTPTAPALTGAIQAAVARAQAEPEHEVAVVFASDGVPTECAPQDIAQIADIAAAALAASPSVRTYVIGIGDVAALNAIAQAGGTDSAFLVSANGNAGQEFLDAMLEIKGSLLACEFDIPAPTMGQLDFGEVNVQFTPDGGSTEVVPQVAGAAACGGNAGWYYDDPGAPTKIVLCEATCTLVQASAKGSIEIVLGCATVVK